MFFNPHRWSKIVKTPDFIAKFESLSIGVSFLNYLVQRAVDVKSSNKQKKRQKGLFIVFFTHQLTFSMAEISCEETSLRLIMKLAGEI